MSNKIVVIGTGIAAVNAIKAIREVDKDIAIDLYGEEKFYPYNRIKLTKGLFDKLEEDNVLLQKKDWYEANGINLFFNRRVSAIDSRNNEIILDDGSRSKYDRLLVVSGSRNFKPPIIGIDKASVYTIRHLEDAWSVRESVNKAKNVLIIGGGIQGLETAWELSKHGEKVVIAELQERIMPNQLDKTASRILQNKIESFNINIQLETQIKEILGESNVEGVKTADDEVIACEMVVYSVGIRPNVEFLKDSGININRGVIVNQNMKTSIDNIYAAGDVAEFNGRISGLWNIAIEQGKTAGYNILDKATSYKDIVPVTTLNAFGISLFSMGNVNENQCDTTVKEEDLEASTYKRIFIKENKVVGAIVIGDTKKSPVLKTAIEDQIVLDNVNFSAISVEDLFTRLKK